MSRSATLPVPFPSRSLLPREHGAWGQLAMPLLSGLLLARPTLPAALLAAATTLAFLAHEPWIVALGQRGGRARSTEGARAVRALALLLASAGLLGVAGLWLAPPPARLAALLPGGLGAIVVLLVLLGQERTLPGELAVASSLAAAGAVVALASGASLRSAAALFAAWAVAFAGTVFAVQAVLARARRRGERDRGALHALATLGVTAAGSAIAVRSGLGWTVPCALLPTAAVSLAVCLAPFRANQLRPLGWSLVAATSATLLILLIGLRPG